MTDQDKDTLNATEEPTSAQDPLDDFAELEQRIRRRLRSNQRFLERFMDEDFKDEEDFPEEDPPPEEEL